MRKTYDGRRKEHLKTVYSKLDRINDYYKGVNVDDLSKRLAKERIERIVSELEGNVLDVGCSGGIVSILAARKGHSCVGVDLVSELIEAAKKEMSKEPKEVQERLLFETAWAEDMPFEDNSFDTVILGEVLEHVMDLEKTLMSAKRVLKPEGKVVVTVPKGDTNNHTHLRIFYPDKLNKIMNMYFNQVNMEHNVNYFIWYVGRNNK